jgi:predicted metal-binding membrane protein
VLVAAGVFQLTPLKTRCLHHCRSPIGQLLRFGNASGRTRDLRFALQHGAFCLGCCWALMALFVVFGVMSVWAMAAVTAVVVGEKVAPHGAGFGRAVGVACIALAVALLCSASVAHTILPSTGGDMKQMNEMTEAGR